MQDYICIFLLFDVDILWHVVCYIPYAYVERIKKLFVGENGGCDSLRDVSLKARLHNVFQSESASSW